MFLVALIVSMAGLGWAAKTIAIGTAYALWTGMGAALTVGYAMLSRVEPVSVGKLVFLAGIIGAATGLKHEPPQRPSDSPVEPRSATPVD